MNRVVFSPDGTQLAIPASPDVSTPVGVTTKVVVVDVATGEITNRIDARAPYASAAWSPDSQRIYVAGTSNGGSGDLLVHDVVANTTRDLGRVLDGAGNLSTVMTRADAARMPSPPVGPAAACRPLLSWAAPDGDGKLCRFRF